MLERIWLWILGFMERIGSVHATGRWEVGCSFGKSGFFYFFFVTAVERRWLGFGRRVLDDEVERRRTSVSGFGWGLVVVTVGKDGVGGTMGDGG